ncbi:MAG: hypothetical protein V2A78_13295 [bacterium]
MRKLFVAILLMCFFAIPVFAEEKMGSSAPPTVKSLLPTTENLSDVQGMIRPKKALCDHKYHALSRCGMLGAKLELEGEHKRDSMNSAYYLKGTVVLKVKVDKMHSGYALKNGYEVELSVDGKLFDQSNFLLVKDPKIRNKKVKEEWSDIGEWKLDTTRFSDGLHRVSVHVCDHFDHYGVNGFKCYIQNGEGRIKNAEVRSRKAGGGD